MLNKILLACCNSNGKLLAILKVTVAFVGNGDFLIRGYSLGDGFGALGVIEGDIQVSMFEELPGLSYGIFMSNFVGSVTLVNDTTGASVKAAYDSTEGANIYFNPILFNGIEDGQECVIVVYA